MKKSLLVTAFAALLCVATSVNAATVKLSLVKDPAAPGCTGCTLSGAGTYQIFAEASQGDNFGISAFNIPVLGVSSILNRSPRTTVDPDDQAAPAGFTSVRSGTNGVVIPGGFALGGGQDNVTPTPFLIRGFGQESSSFAAKLPGMTLASPQTQVSWAAKLLLAEGMYQVGADPHIDFGSVEIGVNVFGQGSGVGTAPAQIIPGGGDTIPPVISALVQNVAWPNVISNLQLSASDDTTPAANLVWSNLVYAGPGHNGSGASATLGANGVFNWDPTGFKGGAHLFTATVADQAGNTTASLALTVNYTVPEPVSFALVGLALVGFAGCRRK